MFLLYEYDLFWAFLIISSLIPILVGEGIFSLKVLKVVVQIVQFHLSSKPLKSE